jgi:hypothetical protein
MGYILKLCGGGSKKVSLVVVFEAIQAAFFVAGMATSYKVS